MKTIIIKLDGEVEKMFEQVKLKYKLETNTQAIKMCIMMAAIK